MDRLQARWIDRGKLEIIETRIRAVVRKRSHGSLDLGVMGRRVDGWYQAVRVGIQSWTDEDVFLTILDKAQLKTLLQQRKRRQTSSRSPPTPQRTYVKSETRSRGGDEQGQLSKVGGDDLSTLVRNQWEPGSIHWNTRTVLHISRFMNMEISIFRIQEAFLTSLRNNLLY